MTITADLQNTDFSMQYDSVEGIAGAIDQKHEEFNTMYQKLNQLVDSFEGQWQGSAQYEFETAYGKLKPKLESILQVLQDYSDEIRTAVKREQNTEAATSKRMNTHGRGKQPTPPSRGGTRYQGMQPKSTKTDSKSNHAQKKETKPGIDELEKRLDESTGYYSKRNSIHYVEVDPSTIQTKIDTDRISNYSDGAQVKKGTIRYVYQNGSYDEKVSNGWGKYTGISGGQCNSACESMALSYLGIDRSPGSMVPEGNDMNGLEVASYGTTRKEWQAPDGRTIQTNNHSYFDKADFDSELDAFLADGNRGKTAPPMIRYRYSNGGGHWLVVVGKNADGSYNVIGPGIRSERYTTVTIAADGNISGDGICSKGGYVERYAQYTVTSGG